MDVAMQCEFCAF